MDGPRSFREGCVVLGPWPLEPAGWAGAGSEAGTEGDPGRGCASLWMRSPASGAQLMASRVAVAPWGPTSPSSFPHPLGLGEQKSLLNENVSRIPCKQGESLSSRCNGRGSPTPQSPNALCPPGRAGHAGCPPRDSRSAKFVPLSLRSSGTGRSPRQELRRSYLGGDVETAWRRRLAGQLLPGRQARWQRQLGVVLRV